MKFSQDIFNKQKKKYKQIKTVFKIVETLFVLIPLICVWFFNINCFILQCLPLLSIWLLPRFLNKIKENMVYNKEYFITKVNEETSQAQILSSTQQMILGLFEMIKLS